MKKIKDVIQREISLGTINWDKLSKKIHATLNLVDNNFKTIHSDGKKVMNVKTEDAITFKTSDCRCIKIFSPRFLNGDLYCKGVQHGAYDLKGQPWFVLSPEMFV